MKEKQALNLRNNRANLDTPSVEPLDSTVTSEIPGDQNGTKKHAYREIIYTEKTKNLEILSPNRVKKVSNKIEAKKCETSSRCGELNITKSLEKIPAKSARLSTISAVRISADNQREKFVVRSHDPSLKKISQTLDVNQKGKKSVKELRNEMERRSIKPITDFFGKKELVHNKENQGMSKNKETENSKNDERNGLENQTKPKSAVGQKF